jgi:hypothetical protein
MEEFKLALSSLKCCKARGWDKLPNECLKFAPDVIHRLLLDLYNRIRAMGRDEVFPSGWNQGRIVLVHKRGPLEMISNYRPLTVIISLSSLYSRLLNARLTVVTEEHNLLGEIQAGFRQGRCCADNNFVLNTILAKASATGQKVHTAYVDLSRAYDTVDRTQYMISSTLFVPGVAAHHSQTDTLTASQPPCRGSGVLQELQCSL